MLYKYISSPPLPKPEPEEPEDINYEKYCCERWEKLIRGHWRIDQTGYSDPPWTADTSRSIWLPRTKQSAWEEQSCGFVFCPFCGRKLDPDSPGDYCVDPEDEYKEHFHSAVLGGLKRFSSGPGIFIRPIDDTWHHYHKIIFKYWPCCGNAIKAHPGNPA